MTSKLAALGFDLEQPVAWQNAEHTSANATFGQFPYNIHPTATPAEWAALQDDLRAGVVSVSEYVMPDVVMPTPAQLANAAVVAVQDALDAEARTHGYDGILSLCTYATSPNEKFAAEGQAGVVWRDACWTALYTYQTDVQAGTVVAPTTLSEAQAAALALMPVMAWPS